MKEQTPTRGKARQLWLQVHLYVGLTLGVILAVVGLTGSLMVFWQPIDAWLAPDLLASETPCQAEAYEPVDAWVAAARTRIPPSGYLGRLFFPNPERALVSLEYQIPTPGAVWDDRYHLFVAPCTGTVTGPRLWDTQRRPWAGPFMAVVARLHTSLFLNRPGLLPDLLLGNHLLSFGSVLLMVSVLVGLYLWWPRNGRWRAAFAFERHASPERRNYDLHKTFGILSAVLLLMSLFTGIHMYSPWTGWIDRTVNLFSPVTTLDAVAPVSLPVPGTSPISPGQALAVAEEAVPGGTPKTLSFPVDERDVYTVTIGTDGVWDSAVSIDQYSGKIVAVSSPENASAGEMFLRWLFPLHTGHAFGLPGRIAILVLGLIPTVLYITGFIRWRQKRRARKAKEARAGDRYGTEKVGVL